MELFFKICSKEESNTGLEITILGELSLEATNEARAAFWQREAPSEGSFELCDCFLQRVT